MKWGALLDDSGKSLRVYHDITNREEKSVWNEKTKTFDTDYKLHEAEIIEADLPITTASQGEKTVGKSASINIISQNTEKATSKNLLMLIARVILCLNSSWNVLKTVKCVMEMEIFSLYITEQVKKLLFLTEKRADTIWIFKVHFSARGNWMQAVMEIM